MPLNDDTLDIKPILPVGATPMVPDFMSGDGVLNPGGDKNPEAAAHARAKIAATDHGIRNEIPAPAPIAPATEPVSPAQGEHKASHPLPVKLPRRLPKAVRPIINAIATFLFILLVFKAPVFYSQLQYLTAKTNPTANQALPAPAATAVAVSPNPAIIIPKINVDAPLVFESKIDEPSIDKALESGVVHYGTSALPGQRGNSVIVGHSSNDWWQPGGYKFVFVLLDKLVPGDPILINYESKQYRYEVIETRVVEATDVSVLAPTKDPIITLITCWPVGTNFKREIIRAKQVSPSPDGSVITTVAAAPSNVTLPGNAPSWSQQIKDFWNSITSAFSHKPTEVQSDTQLPK